MIVSRTADVAVSNIVSGAPTEVDTFIEVAEILANKVDKVSGKELSSNDYTKEEKDKVSMLAVSRVVDLDLLQTQVERLLQGDNAGTVEDFELSL